MAHPERCLCPSCIKPATTPDEWLLTPEALAAWHSAPKRDFDSWRAAVQESAKAPPAHEEAHGHGEVATTPPASILGLPVRLDASLSPGRFRLEPARAVVSPALFAALHDNEQALRVPADGTADVVALSKEDAS